MKWNVSNFTLIYIIPDFFIESYIHPPDKLVFLPSNHNFLPFNQSSDSKSRLVHWPIRGTCSRSIIAWNIHAYLSKSFRVTKMYIYSRDGFNCKRACEHIYTWRELISCCFSRRTSPWRGSSSTSTLHSCRTSWVATNFTITWIGSRSAW